VSPFELGASLLKLRPHTSPLGHDPPRRQGITTRQAEVAEPVIRFDCRGHSNTENSMAEFKDMPKIELPDKIYFKIGEASRIAGVQPHVLRFWETEFKRIKPKRTSSGQRMYRKKDVELILTIKHLLYVNKYTIEGAKNALRTKPSTTPKMDTNDTLKEIREELVRIRDMLD